MSPQISRLVPIGIAAVLGLGWMLVDRDVSQGRGALAGASPLGVQAAVAGVGNHDLRRLSILEHDLYIVRSRYVDKDRLDPEEMFSRALDAVERDIAEVMFVRVPGGDKVHISVGTQSTVLPLEPLNDLDALFAELSRVVVFLDTHLPADVARPEIEYALVNGALSTLDPHSILLPPVAAEEMDVDNQGEFGGLGVEISSRDGRLLIKNPMPDTPASRVGLKSDDHIIRIEGESTINMDLDEAVSRLRGEVGSTVEIEVLRKGRSQPIPFTIVRAAIRINPVEGELLEGNIGYVRIKAFHASVATDLADLLARFGRESSGDVQGLVLDLRSNPGGYLNQAIKVCDLFLKEGVIVSTVEGGDRRFEHNYAENDGGEPDYPITVLVNASSASASEIVAGALRNQRRAVIIGERTFGKGSVQHLYDHRHDNSRLKLTVAQYLTPGERSIQSVGIPPDIALKPSVVVEARPDEGEDEALVSLYWREWVSREADLDHHLDHASATVGEDAAYTLRYLRPENPDDDGGEPSVQEDWEVQLAREMLLSAPSARRADMLTAAAPIIERYQRSEAQKLEAAFAEMGIDWSAGSNDAISVDVALDSGADNLLIAGQPERLTLSVTNTGEQPIYQLSVTTEADSPALDQREFYFGKIDPGERREFSVRVSLPVGYGDESAPLRLVFRDPSNAALWSTDVPVHIQGQPLPRLMYSIQLFDDGTGNSEGDGDGIPEVGETIDAALTVTNIGDGPTVDAYARIKNRSGRSLDLTSGTIEVGQWTNGDGEACDVGEDGCTRTLAVGESHADRLTFSLQDLPEDGQWQIELLVGDNQAYDYSTVSQGGFYSYFQHKETLTFTPEAAPDWQPRRPPEITIARRPELQSSEMDAVVSGIVRDDQGVQDVIIFQGEDKVFFWGGTEDGAEIPFTVDSTFEEGMNSIYVLARDFHGLTTSAAVRTWTHQPENAASAMSQRPQSTSTEQETP